MPAVSTQLNDFILPATPARPRTASSGWFARLMTALHAARMRSAEREIALLIERQGGRMTDELERRIERHLI